MLVFKIVSVQSFALQTGDLKSQVLRASTLPELASNLQIQLCIAIVITKNSVPVVLQCLLHGKYCEDPIVREKLGHV